MCAGKSTSTRKSADGLRLGVGWGGVGGAGHVPKHRPSVKRDQTSGCTLIPGYNLHRELEFRIESIYFCLPVIVHVYFSVEKMPLHIVHIADVRPITSVQCAVRGKEKRDTYYLVLVC